MKAPVVHYGAFDLAKSRVRHYVFFRSSAQRYLRTHATRLSSSARNSAIRASIGLRYRSKSGALEVGGRKAFAFPSARLSNSPLSVKRRPHLPAIRYLLYSYARQVIIAFSDTVVQRSRSRATLHGAKSLETTRPTQKLRSVNSTSLTSLIGSTSCLPLQAISSRKSVTCGKYESTIKT